MNRNELKQKVLKFDAETSILKLQDQYEKMLFFKGHYGFCPPDLDENYLHYVHYKFTTECPELWDEADRINKATYERTRRLRKKIYWLLSNFECSFLTFDFSDETLQLDANYRRILIQRTCNALDTYYIGNIDFGSDDFYTDNNGLLRIGTNREHYHVIVAKKCDTRSDEALATYCDNYGHVHCEPCRMSRSDVSRLAKYTSKLTNHAMKETAKRSALLYSRKHQIPKNLPDFPKGSVNVLIQIDDKDVLQRISHADYMDFVFAEQLSFLPKI